MGMPLGARAKLSFDIEGTYGTPNTTTIDEDTGFRVYFDSFAADVDKTPEDEPEISGVSIDYTEFVEGAIIVGGTLTHRVRYYGGHAVLFGLAMGDLTTTGGPAPYIHTANLADDLDAATVYYQQPVIVSGATVLKDNIFPGMKINRATWRHQSGGSLTFTAEFIGSYADYSDLGTSTPMTHPGPDSPSLSDGRYPNTTTEPYVHWSHLQSGSLITLDVDGRTPSPVTINCHSYEITLDNRLTRLFRLQNGRKTAEPPRDDFRLITGRMEVEQDEGWEEFMAAYGPLNTDSTTDCDIDIHYEDPNDAQNELEFIIANCRAYRVPRGTTTRGSVRQTVEFRAHYRDNDAVIANPLRIIMDNGTEGPTSPSPAAYGSFV